MNHPFISTLSSILPEEEEVEELSEPLQVYNTLLAGNKVILTFCTRIDALKYTAYLRVVKSRQDKIALSLDMEVFPLSTLVQYLGERNKDPVKVTFSTEKKKQSSYNIISSTIESNSVQPSLNSGSEVE